MSVGVPAAQAGDRKEPCTAVKGTFMARKTCDGSSDPDVQADPLDAQIPASLN